MYTARCEKCGKKLLVRQDSGLWKFVFGRYGPDAQPVVDMTIHGSISMVCIRKSCRHRNQFDFFPNTR